MDPTAFELTLEQQFEMRRMHQEVQDMSHEQTLDLLLQVSRLLMVKDNVIRDLMKRSSL